MEMCIGEDNLRQQKERMDKLSELKRKLRAYQYLENLRIEVLADSLFRTEEKMERQQEEPVVSESRRVIIFAKIEAQILKRIIPSNRNAVMTVKWMKIIIEHHQKIADVHTELSRKIQQQDSDSFEEISRDLEDKNKPNTLSKKKEEKQFEPMTDKRMILIHKIQVDLLRTMLPSDGTSKMAIKYMRMIRDNHVVMLTIQKEMLKKLEKRDDNFFADSFRNLENLNQNKWNATLDAWDKEKRNQILFSILVDQVRKMRTRRCPQMAGKMMKKLQDRHLDLKNLQEELMKSVNEREKNRQAKKAIEEELLMEINRKEEMTTRRKMVHKELMSYHFERTVEEDTLFIPRKLFLTGVETFKTVPKLDDAPRDVNERKDGPSASFSYEDQPQPQSQPKTETKAKLTLKSRIKRIFGFR
ncbi:chromosome partition protein Smc-like [Magallana gigas]|uniref:chromosome partition protein Smc-like n=1 Tax=Magallana gigas TaxID=29159 RepID=UPI0033402F2D